MYARIFLTFIAVAHLLELAVADHSSFSHSHESVPMTSRSHLSERHHIGDHLGDVVGDLELMQEDELKFLYFRMHDSDGNEKLDGWELVDSLLHFHGEEGSDKIFRHEELSNMIDPILLTDDRNADGFIDYHEFVIAQKARGFWIGELLTLAQAANDIIYLLDKDCWWSCNFKGQRLVRNEILQFNDYAQRLPRVGDQVVLIQNFAERYLTKNVQGLSFDEDHQLLKLLNLRHGSYPIWITLSVVFLTFDYRYWISILLSYWHHPTFGCQQLWLILYSEMF